MASLQSTFDRTTLRCDVTALTSHHCELSHQRTGRSLYAGTSLNQCVDIIFILDLEIYFLSIQSLLETTECNVDRSYLKFEKRAANLVWEAKTHFGSQRTEVSVYHTIFEQVATLSMYHQTQYSNCLISIVQF